MNLLVIKLSVLVVAIHLQITTGMTTALIVLSQLILVMCAFITPLRRCTRPGVLALMSRLPAVGSCFCIFLGSTGLCTSYDLYC